MLEELNELIESMLLDIASEGTGAALGIALMWGLFFGGTFTIFSALMTVLISTV